MRTKSTGVVLALVALLAGSAALYAVAQARVRGTVRDENGAPVVGVKVVVTSDEVSTFHLEDTTNGQGEWGVTLLDATRTYTYTLEKEGYQTVAEKFKVAIGANEIHDFEMITIEEAQRRGPSGRELSSADRAVLIFNEGAEASQMGDTATARSKFEEAIGLDPNLAAAYSALATLAFTEGDYQHAVELGEKARSIDSGDVKAMRVLVEAYGKLGDSAKVAEISEALAVRDPKSGAADLLRQGIEIYNQGDNAGALALFDKALAADPELPKAHYMAGLCLVATDAAAAREHLEKFLELAPDDVDAGTARDMLQYLK